MENYQLSKKALRWVLWTQDINKDSLGTPGDGRSFQYTIPPYSDITPPPPCCLVHNPVCKGLILNKNRDMLLKVVNALNTWTFWDCSLTSVQPLNYSILVNHPEKDGINGEAQVCDASFFSILLCLIRVKYVQKLTSVLTVATFKKTAHLNAFSSPWCSSVLFVCVDNQKTLQHLLIHIMKKEDEGLSTQQACLLTPPYLPVTYWFSRAWP